jgi:hypothetical protein
MAVSGDILVGSASVKVETTISSDASNITLTLPDTAFPATGDIAITFKAYCYPDKIVTQVVKKNAPEFGSKIIYIQESTPVSISYTSDSAWLAAAPVVSVNGTVVDSSKYTLSATELTFADRSLFNALGNYQVTISANGYIDATADIIVSDDLSYLITATSDSTGTISPSGSVAVKYGEDQTFTITPNSGYEIDSVKVDGKDVTVTNNSYTFTNVKSNHTFNVTFKRIVHTLTATAGDHGSINPSGSVSVNEGNDKTFTITPESGYEIAVVKVDGVEVAVTNNSYTFANVTSNHTIDVTFKRIVYTITATAGEHGKISPSGGVSVIAGANQTFTITPDSGYEIDALKVDGIAVTVNNSYTFTNVTGNHMIDVTFKDVTAPPAPVVNKVTDVATTITGTTEAGAKVTAKVGTQIIGEGTANATGQFTITIANQSEGTTLVVTATDAANNISAPTTVKVTDGTPPLAPVVNVVKDTDKKVYGKAEAGSIVTIKVRAKVIGTAKAEKDGSFTVVIPAQKAGTVLKVTATDLAGNTSNSTNVTVIDKTPHAKIL